MEDILSVREISAGGPDVDPGLRERNLYQRRDGSRAMVGRQVLLLVLMLIIWIAPVICQNQSGYLSIDCGSDLEYRDDTTGITWETDDKYISTGKNEQGITFPNRYATVINRRQMKTLRYFDEGRSRDCYVLPVKPKLTYLLRPTFFYGNWRSKGPSNFDVYLNDTFWLSIATGSGVAQDAPYAYEALVYSTGTQLNFCLLKITGAPFIASLELRELSQGMYSLVVGNDKFMSLLDRGNPGVPLDGPSLVRYPDDIYDRIWYPAGGYGNPNGQDGVVSFTKNDIKSSYASAPNRPPTKVMEDAWINYSGNRTGFLFSQDFGAHDFQIYGYFQELDGNASESNVRGMNYIVSDDIVIAFNTTDQPQQQGSTFSIHNNEIIKITVAQASWSNLGTMLNAWEVYSVFDCNTTETALSDVNVLVGVKERFNLTDWTGDPCRPVPYDWLTCAIDPHNPSIARVTRLFPTNESTRMPGTTESMPLVLTNLTALIYLNLSYNNLTTPPTNLKELNLTVLDVSNNRLGGNVGNFLEAINLHTVQEIHAADNQFEGEFRIDMLVQQKNVKIWNFDRNLNVSGRLDLSNWQASLLAAVQGGTLSALPLFSLVDNNITDIYPGLNSLEKAIEEVLNLENKTALNKGILLGGNPYCKQAKSSSLAVKYLCRFSTGQNDALFKRGSRGKSRSDIIGIVLGSIFGLFIVLSACICVPMLWNLKKQTYALLEIQEALAKQQVQPPFYSFTQLRAATADFSPNNKLGEGAFGAVYKAVGVDGAILAVKKLKLTNQVMTEFLNEVVLITGIKHRNLVQLKGCCIQEKQRILVYEYAENGNVAEALWEYEGIMLDWEKRLNICVGVARGLSYLHEELQPRIIHRDIKSANILIDKTFNAKIADFGLARLFLDDQSQADYQSQADFSQRAGTLGYLAPEYATLGQLTEKADVFSFGVLLLEIVSGRKCIDHKLPLEKRFLLNLTKELHEEGRLLDLLEPAIQETSNNIDEEVTRVINIALLCVEVEPRRRPTMSQIVTMLQGNMDVPRFIHIQGPLSRDRQSFNSLYAEFSSKSRNSPVSQIVTENYPLLSAGSLITNSQGGLAMEMSALNAR